MQQKIITLTLCLTLSNLFAFELQLKKPRLEASPSQNAVFPLPDLPIELQLHTAFFIKEPTIEQTVKKIKAYLLTNRQKAAFLADEAFMKNLLLHLQERDHHSVLECATHMASIASKKMAHHLRQEGQKCLQEFLLSKEHKQTYPIFVFKKHSDAHLIPSLLYSVLSNNHNLEQALNNHNESCLITYCYQSANNILHITNMWIASGLLTNRKNLANLWNHVVLEAGTDPSSMVIARTLINAGYSINCTLDNDGCLWQTESVKRLPPTLLDYIMQRIYLFHDQAGVNRIEAIANLHRLLRMVVTAGGKSNYELQQA